MATMFSVQSNLFDNYFFIVIIIQTKHLLAKSIVSIVVIKTNKMNNKVKTRSINKKKKNYCVNGIHLSKQFSSFDRFASPLNLRLLKKKKSYKSQIIHLKRDSLLTISANIDVLVDLTKQII